MYQTYGSCPDKHYPDHALAIALVQSGISPEYYEKPYDYTQDYRYIEHLCINLIEEDADRWGDVRRICSLSIDYLKYSCTVPRDTSRIPRPVLWWISGLLVAGLVAFDSLVLL